VSARELITEHLDLWTGAVTEKSRSGRGSNGKIELTGIKKLRELILELAVRGKLLAQNEKDEPAKELISRIAIEKSELILEGKLKKQQALQPVRDGEAPYSLPANWIWTRLGNYGADIHYGYTASANEQLSEYRLLRITDIQNDRVNWATVPGCEISKQQAEPYLLSGNDILIARTGGTIGKSFLVEDINVNAVFASYLIRLKKLEATYARYVKVFLGSNTYWSQLYEASMGTGQPNVNGRSLKNLLFPVPPLKEQHRIVQKVDELMALCDRLEQQTSDQLEAHETLVNTLLGTLTQSENTTELTDNWARLAAHFDTLFTTEQSIDKLKQTILQLAVMGRLVEQDARDVHARELVATATQTKEKLILEGKLKRPRKVRDLTEGENAHKLPYGWSRIKVGELFQLQNGYAFKSSWFTERGARLLRNVNISHGYVDWSESVCLPETMATEFKRFELNRGDLVISLDRPLISTGLKYAIIRDCDTPCLLLQRVARFQQYYEAVNLGYLEYWLNSEMFTSSIDPGRSNGVPHISTSQIGALDFPLPPTNEQHRIVQKVDELTALCDQLKERLNQASETRCQCSIQFATPAAL
jgi:type I restriction enzyme S subunit